MQNLKLQVLWLNSSLGLAVNHETTERIIPLTPYYFWPINDAWEQIRFELDLRLWIPKEERIKLLNLAVNVMNEWQRDQIDLKNNKITRKKSIVIKDVTILGIQ